jgi:nucleoside-diphosphate-sugar epimerase
MILVTGGTGLVGSHLLYKLAKQKEGVIAIRRKSSDMSTVKKVFSYYTDNYETLYSSIQWLEADINDVPSLTKAFEGVTHVYHSAALISFDSADYKLMRKVNIEGTANIVNLCILNKIEKLCFVSSVAAVGKPLSDEEITENCDWNAEESNYGYAITKYGAEIEVWRASQEGIDVVIVNPGVIFGSGFWHGGSGKMFSKIYHGFKFYTEGITGFIGVTDVVTVMIKLMKSNIKNERYILVSENDSFKSVFFAIADGFGSIKPSIQVSKLLSGLGWRIGWILHKITGKKQLITRQSANSAHNKYLYSNKKIKDTLNFEFEPLKDTIQYTCKNFLSDK